jgi:ribonucleoside-diphosphate reductase alpha chain
MLGLIDRSAIVTDPPITSALGGTSGPVSSSPAVTEVAALAPQAEEGLSAIDEAMSPPEAKSTEGKAKPAADTPKATAVATPPAESATASSDELKVIAKNGHSNGHGAAPSGGVAKAITLSLGTTNVAFKIQEDAPSCAECGSIMVRNGSCYKCLNCGSTSGCS